MEISMTNVATCLPDHAGTDYLNILHKLHNNLKPKAYLEIGTLEGRTLKLAECPSIAIDPKFQIKSDVLGTKDRCHFFQMGSDDFFDRYKASEVLSNKIDLAFLDGMHQCEFLLRDFFNTEKECHSDSVVAMHDCLPLETGMTVRIQSETSSIMPHRRGWWTGDVWRVLYALKKFRPELKTECLDAQPTGLVLVTNIDSSSTKLSSNYDEIVRYMLSLDLDLITPGQMFEDVGVTSCVRFN